MYSNASLSNIINVNGEFKSFSAVIRTEWVNLQVK